MSFGFAVRVDPRGAEFRVAAAGAALVSGPVADGPLAAIVAGRLHYRADARAAIGGEAAAFAGPDGDARLALALYAQRGAAGLAALEGDFALAVWDGRRRLLLARRDPLGAYPLFWRRLDDGLALATALPLLPGADAAAIDAEHVADYLAVPGLVGEFAAERTAYRDIRRVLPDAVTTLAPDGDARRGHGRDWPARMVSPRSVAEAGAALAAALAASVRERHGRRTAAHCSGGVDSSAVALLAARQGGPVAALSLVYDRLAALARERPYLDAALAAGGDTLAPRRVAADDLLYYDDLDDPPPHDEPFPGLVALRLDRALVAEAAAAGADALLTGQGGDDFFAPMPHHIADDLRRLRLAAAWREARRWADARGSTPWRILRLAGLDHVLPALTLGPLGRALGFARARPLERLDAWSLPNWIDPGFARGHRLPDRLAAAARAERRRAASVPLALALAGIERRVGDPARFLLAAPAGMALAHPFLDPRVVALGLGCVARLRPDPAQAKPVPAAAFRGLVPDAILDRRDKRSFNEVHYLGLARNRARAAALASDPAADPLACLDRAVLAAALDRAALGGADPFQLRALDATLSLMTWFRREAAWRRRAAPIARTFVAPATD